MDDPAGGGTIVRADIPLGGGNGARLMRVVVAEDSVLLREGVARLLQDAGHEVVGQAGDADDLMRKVRAHKPDLAVVDVRMPPTQTDEGLRAAKEIRAEPPASASSSSPATSSRPTRRSCWRRTPRDSATCSRIVSPT